MAVRGRCCCLDNSFSLPPFPRPLLSTFPTRDVSLSQTRDSNMRGPGQACRCVLARMFNTRKAYMHTKGIM